MVPIVKQVKGMALPEFHIFWEHFLEDNQFCWAHPAIRGPIKIKDVCSVNLFFWTAVLVPLSYFPLEFLCEFISCLLCPPCLWHWAVRHELSRLALGKLQALVSLPCCGPTAGSVGLSATLLSLVSSPLLERATRFAL